MFGKDQPALLIRSGSRKGKKIKLRRATITLGADKKCQVVLNDPSVEKHHATLHRRGPDQWEIENRSVNGTSVDQMPVQKKMLKHGALIRLGQGTLLELTLPSTDDARASSDTRRKGLGISRGAMVGIGFWYVILAGGLYYISDSDDITRDLGVLSVSQVNQALEATRKFLNDLPPISNAADIRIDPGSEEAADFFELRYRDAQDNQVRRSLRTNTILDKLEGLFFKAALQESQQRWSEALLTYQDITAVVPDVTYPSTWLAMDRIRKLRQVINDES